MYRIDSNIKLLWIIIWKCFLFCIFKTKILKIFINVHNKGDHWKKKTLIKFRNLIYWFNQPKNIVRYIFDCVKCVRHELTLKFQFLHFIKIFHSFQLLKMNYIDLFFRTFNDNIYIFHIINYLIRFFLFMFASQLFRKMFNFVFEFCSINMIFLKSFIQIMKFTSMLKKSEFFEVTRSEHRLQFFFRIQKHQNNEDR